MRIPAALCLYVMMCSAGAYAQAVAGFGAITGKVRDIYGDGIPDTTVTVTNRELGLRLVLTTTDDGVFYAPTLAPAAGYAVKITRKGFAGWDAAGCWCGTSGPSPNRIFAMRASGCLRRSRWH